MVVEEMVTIFLHLLSFEEKNREIKYHFQRSGETISRHFNNVLKAVLKLSSLLLKKPEPIPENSTDERWKWFKNCIGAIDGTLINVNVPAIDKSRWEGSAADGRVLRSALNRNNGLKVTRARNVVERAFGLLKVRWEVLAKGTKYPLSTQIDIILACVYIHKLIRQQMSIDPMEAILDAYMEEEGENDEIEDNGDYIRNCGASEEWTNFRNTLAQDMYDAFLARRQ
ncbi:uncharacterized protein LOC130808383 [Amaranthus tricolor]|uniref:uncharacterized protein LOC130808383 n=1 Tax=Amaranthus tricolor TaxID=29722 RepID=UPI002588A768|nr:uncharacterized protein LOC130808383 [Amaranthus tricolor]